MKTHLLIFLSLPFFSFSQSIFEKAAESKKSNQSNYIEEPIASSNAYAFKHKNYTPKRYGKILYFVNTEDEKTNKVIKKEFKSIGIEANNFIGLPL